MRPDDFQELLRRRPFQPFRMHLSSGGTYEIRHPELALVGRSIVWIEVPNPESAIPLARRKVIIILIHIVQIEFIESTPGPVAN